MPKFSFFDVDETIVALKSTVSFQEFWCLETGDQGQWSDFQAKITKMRNSGESRERLNREYYRYFAGRSVEDVRTKAEAWFARVEQGHACLFYPAVLDRLREHQAAGEEPVFVSGSFTFALEPIARKLNVRNVLATELVSVDGRYTGAIDGPQIIGPGKVWAIQDFLVRHGGRAEDCFAYGDDISDRFMLGLVGHPTVISGNKEMEVYARQRGWPILDPLEAQKPQYGQKAIMLDGISA